MRHWRHTKKRTRFERRLCNVEKWERISSSSTDRSDVTQSVQGRRHRTSWRRAEEGERLFTQHPKFQASREIGAEWRHTASHHSFHWRRFDCISVFLLSSIRFSHVRLCRYAFSKLFSRALRVCSLAKELRREGILKCSFNTAKALCLCGWLKPESFFKFLLSLADYIITVDYVFTFSMT